MMLDRIRLTTRIAAAADHRVTLLVAPAGYGKTIALDAYLRTLDTGVLRFNVRRSDTSLARFARALAAAFEPALPRIAQSLAIAHERAAQSPKPSDVLAAWLAEHLEGGPRTIVIDDLHNCEGERGIAALIASAVERTAPHVRWIFAAHSTSDFPLARWLARDEIVMPLDERALRLTNDEALSIGAAFAPMLSPAVVLRLHDRTGGAAAAFAFAVRTVAQNPHDAERLIGASGSPFACFAHDVFARFDSTDRTRLVESVALPELDDELIASGVAPAAWIESVEARAPQIFKHSRGGRHYADLFFRYLRDRLEERGSEAVRAAGLRAAAALEAAGRTDEALALYIRERDDVALVRLIETHGFAFLEAGHGESIHEAIAALDPYVQMSTPVVLAIKAVWESTSGRFDTAESWFQLALDRSREPLRSQIGYQYGTHLLRFFRPEAVDVFEQLAGAEHITEKLRAYALAALGPAYVFERRLEDARRVTDEALVLATELGAPHAIAKGHFQASYVALYAGDAERAKRLASIAYDIATGRGFYDIAAGSLSVLYNVASDIEDDPQESLRLLEAVGDCAAKSGSLTNQLIALVASLEIEVERNNEAVAVRIDEKLQALDVSLAGRATYEALLPAQALRATWTADFDGAYRLLENSAGKHWSADRRALRLAEIAAYAAAAGLEREASDAMRAAFEVLRRVGKVDLRVQRARSILALAAIVLGRTETAAEILATIDETPASLSPRLLALRRVLDALFERYRGSRNHDGLMARLLELDAHGFAGVARMISMLPLGDNASRRANLLTRTERAVMVRWADGDEIASEEQLTAIASKLGCHERDAVLRSVIWHRDAYERENVR